MHSNNGFTLIELLVVIAIVSLLSGTVLTSFSQARAKADIGAVKAQLSQLRTEIVLLDSSGQLGTTPPTGDDFGDWGTFGGAGGSPMSCFVSEGGALRAHLSTTFFADPKVLTIMRQIDVFNRSDILMCAIGRDASSGSNVVARWRIQSVQCNAPCYLWSPSFVTNERSVCIDSTLAFKGLPDGGDGDLYCD